MGGGGSAEVRLTQKKEPGHNDAPSKRFEDDVAAISAIRRVI